MNEGTAPDNAAGSGDLVFRFVSSVQRCIAEDRVRDIADLIPADLPAMHHCIVRDILVRTVLRAYRSHGQPAAEVIIPRLAALATAGPQQLRESFQQVWCGISEEGRPVRDTVDRRVARLLQVLRAAPARRSRVQDVARQAGVSRWHLERLIKASTGMTFTACCRSVRMRCAADRLGAPGMAVKEVAAELGYVQLSSFCRDFKKIHGVSPRRWSARRD